MPDTKTLDEQRLEPKRILLLDDDAGEIRLLREHLNGAGYKVVKAKSWSSALQKVSNREVDLLLLDPKAPGVDGADIRRRLHSDSQAAAVPVILLTDPLDQVEDTAFPGIEADDFVCRPFHRAELLVRVRAQLRLKDLHDDLVATNVQLRQVNRELMTRNRELEQGMEMAHKLQEALLPQKYPDIKNILFCHKYTPADAIGGDFFEIIDLGQDRVALFLSDVSGHGVRAALVTSAVKALLDNVEMEGKSPGEILCEINSRFRAVLGHMAPQVFATGFLMIIDGANRTLRVANAGHPNPLLIRKDDMTVTPVMDEEKGGPALGFISAPHYEIGERQLKKRDIVLGFTDGIYEVRNPNDEYYGIERLTSLIEQNARLIPRDLIQKIVTETEAFMGTRRWVDDICLVAVEVH